MYEDMHDQIGGVTHELSSALIPVQRNTEQQPVGRRLIVRNATAADHARMRRVLRVAYSQYDGDIPIDIYATYLSGLLDLQVHAELGQLFVAEFEGRVIGTAAFYPDISRQRLRWPAGWAGGRALAVHPVARGLGAARALLAEAEERAREAGSPVFAVHTMPFMTSAVSLYERSGYQRAPAFDIDLATAYGLSTAEPFELIAYVRDLQ